MLSVCRVVSFIWLHKASLGDADEDDDGGDDGEEEGSGVKQHSNGQNPISQDASRSNNNDNNKNKNNNKLKKHAIRTCILVFII